MRIQSAHGGDSRHGVKLFKIHYVEERHHWKSNAQDIVSQIYSTADWREIPMDFLTDNAITLHERITDPILFKFVPLLTDQIHIYVLDSHEPNQDVHINELELYNDCKLQFAQ